MTKLPLIIIVGPTASGKTSLSIKLAQTFNGAVVSADSRQVYRGLDIGSGKVTETEMAGIKHYLLDIIDPVTVYTASDFTHDARLAIADIIKNKQLPIIAGGTFFYVSSLLGDISLPQVAPNDTLRKKLAHLTKAELVAELEKIDTVRAASVDHNNPRRLIRAIEIASTLGQVPLPVLAKTPYRTLKLGINIDKETLHNNIHQRLISRLDEGMVSEVEQLIASGVTHERLEGLGLEYRYLSRYLRGLISYDDMVIELETKIRQFAKRQYTWLKRDSDIVWVNPEDCSTITDLVTTFILDKPIP